MLSKFIKLIILASCMLVPTTMLLGQETSIWTLEQCINHALQHNLSIKQTQLDAQYSELKYEQKKRYDRLPSVNASSRYTIGFGRVLDNSNYTYSTQTTHNGSIGVDASVPLFQGFSAQNTIKKYDSDWKASMEQVAITQNDISLSIATYYLQILFDRELLGIAKEQYKITEQQIERAKILVSKGSSPSSVYFEMNAQGAKEALNITVQENNLMLSKLNLAQLLDLEDVNNFDVIIPQIPDSLSVQVESAANIYVEAEKIMPEIKQASYKIESSQYDLDIARGSLYPRLSLASGWGSNLSYIKNNPFDFSSQFKDNSNSYVGLTLSIPIFNGLSARYNVKGAHIGVLSANYELESQKIILRKKIQQAWADANAAWKKYSSAIAASKSYEELFRQTETRFNDWPSLPLSLSL